jgi:glutamine amidotransferase
VIAIVDYGLGNLGSVSKALRHCGAQVVLSADPAVLAEAEALVLPGDGAFGATMDEIRGRGLEGPLHAAVRRGQPLLGICIGMQVLFEEGHEHGRHAGLGLLPGTVRRLPDGVRVPHMGWNALRRRQPHPVVDAVPDGAHVYFVHSYFCDAAPDVVLATTEHGVEFPAIVGRGALLGMQFHPEKSQSVGLALMQAWVASVSASRLPARRSA